MTPERVCVFQTAPRASFVFLFYRRCSHDLFCRASILGSASAGGSQPWISEVCSCQRRTLVANLPRRWCVLEGLAYSGGVAPGASFHATGLPADHCAQNTGSCVIRNRLHNAVCCCGTCRHAQDTARLMQGSLPGVDYKTRVHHVHCVEI